VVQQISSDRCRVTLATLPKWGQPKPIVHALLICTPAQSGVMRSRIQQWLDEADEQAKATMLY
jgi:hypothetical protein